MPAVLPLLDPRRGRRTADAPAPAASASPAPGRERQIAEVLGVLAASEHAPVRASAARRLGQLPAEVLSLAEPALASLAADRDREVARTAAEALGELLAGAPGLDAARIVAGWAADPRPAHRLAIARALKHGTDILGARTAIEALAADPEPEIRSAAAAAAWIRRGQARLHYIGILERLRRDSDRAVRALAELALVGY
jgi:hypothetical protein